MKSLSKNFGLIQEYILDTKEFTIDIEKLLLKMESAFYNNEYNNLARDSRIFTESILQYLVGENIGTIRALLKKLMDKKRIPTEIIDAIHLIKKYGNSESHSMVRRDKTFVIEIDNNDAIQILKASFRLLKYSFLEKCDDEDIRENIKNWKYSKEAYNEKSTENIESIFSSIDDSTSVKLKSLTEIVHSTNQFIIPTYQRRYTWSNESINMLITDIQSRMEDKKQHYMGALAIAQISDEPDMPKRIIDGQQRLTTTLILLKSLSDIFLKNEWTMPKELADLIKVLPTKYVNNATINNDQLNIRKILCYGKIDTFSPKSPAYLNYETFVKHLSKLSQEKLLEFYTTFAMNFRVAELLFDRKMDDEIDIFENLNSKGTVLSSWDLIKNYFFTRFDSKTLIANEVMIEQIIKEKIVMPTSSFFSDKWEEPIGNFFNIFNRIQYVMKKKEIYKNNEMAHKAFKNVWPSRKTKFKNISEFEEELMLVVKYLNIFNILKSQSFFNNTNSPLAFASLHLKNLSAKDVHFPLIIQIIFQNTIWEGGKIKKITNQEEIIDLVKILDVYITRLLVVKGTGQSLGGVFDKILLNYSNAKSDMNESIWNHLSDLEGENSTPSLEQFIEALNHPLKREMSMNILRSIEYLTYKHKTVSGKHVTLEKPTLEHIFPQKPDKTWEREGVNEAEFKRLLKNNFVDKIGNHLILGHKLNIKASNNGFKLKLIEYKKESSKLIRGFHSPEALMDLTMKESFRFEDIKNRTEQIQKICKHIYKDIF